MDILKITLTTSISNESVSIFYFYVHNLLYSNFKQNLKGFIDMVLSTRAPLYIKRTKGEDVVVISKSDYDSMQETLYLLNNSKNAERLAKGIKEYNQGKDVKRDLIE